MPLPEALRPGQPDDAHALLARVGEDGLPQLLDPNAGRALSGARAITDYLDRSYET